MPTVLSARLARWPVTVLLFAGATLFAPLLHATSPSEKTGEASRKAAKVTFVDTSSHETPAAREKRLKRECKGRPNAGMCLGYAR